MAIRFIHKNFGKNRAYHKSSEVPVVEEVKKQNVSVPKKTKNKKEKIEDDMNITNEQIAAAEMAASNMEGVKVVKKDRGLIERTESSKIILTEDNRQVLND